MNEKIGVRLLLGLLRAAKPPILMGGLPYNFRAQVTGSQSPDSKGDNGCENGE
jgi:hypothetical protein